MKILIHGVHPDLFIEPIADNVALSWMRPRWSSRKAHREVSKKVLEAPLDKVAIVDQVADDSKEATSQP